MADAVFELRELFKVTERDFYIIPLLYKCAENIANHSFKFDNRCVCKSQVLVARLASSHGARLYIIVFWRPHIPDDACAIRQEPGSCSVEYNF